jgi:hypothetical protein
MPAKIDLRRFARLSRRDRALFDRTWILLAAIRTGLVTVRFRSVFRALDRLGGNPRGTPIPQDDVERIVWAVERASLRIPGARCLDRALAARFLLARRGLTTKLMVGTRKGERGHMGAHAWLERDGVILIGDEPHLSSYAALPAITKEVL